MNNNKEFQYNGMMIRDTACENAVIASIISFDDAYASTLEYLDEDCFQDENNKDVWKACRNVADRGDKIDLLTTFAELQKIGSSVPIEYLVDLTAGAIHYQFDVYAMRLRELSMRRKLMVLGIKLVNVGQNEEHDLDESRQQVIDEIQNMFGKSEGISTLADALIELNEQIKIHVTKGESMSGTATGLKPLDDKGGFQASDLIIIAGETSQGKALRMNEKILTPNGWVLNKDIKVGDEVCSIDGKPSFVTGVYPQGVKDMYCITFNDGRKAYCSGDHLWEIESSAFKSGNRVLNTLSIKYMQEHSVAFHNRMAIPNFCGIYGRTKDFVIPPYILGVLIGDGCLTQGVRYCNEDAFVTEKVSRLSAYPVKELNIKNRAKIYTLSSGRGNTENVYLNELRRLNLYNCDSHNKFIPEEYLDCSREQRIELLNGLMDTDGEIDKNGCIHYSTVSERLAENVVYLCRSLGLRCSVYEHESKFNCKTYANHFRITIAGDDESFVFTLPRRKERVKNRKRTRLGIVSVEYIGKEECQCIKVSHPRELFVIDNFIVTHNTAIALSMAHYAIKNGTKIAMYSMEMTKKQCASRIVAYETNISASKILYSTSLNSQELRMIDEAQLRLNVENLFFDDRSTSNIDTILISIRTMKMRYDIDGAIVDYLQILNVNMKNNNKEQAMGDVARRLKNLAKELNIWIIALSQLNRDRNDPVPNLNRLRDSGQIAEAADIVMFVYRPEYYHRNFPNPFENVDVANKAMVDVAKGRNIGTFKFLCGFNNETAHFVNDMYQPQSNSSFDGLETYDDAPY